MQPGLKHNLPVGSQPETIAPPDVQRVISGIVAATESMALYSAANVGPDKGSTPAVAKWAANLDNPLCMVRDTVLPRVFTDTGATDLLTYRSVDAGPGGSAQVDLVSVNHYGNVHQVFTMQEDAAATLSGMASLRPDMVKVWAAQTAMEFGLEQRTAALDHASSSTGLIIARYKDPSSPGDRRWNFGNLMIRVRNGETISRDEWDATTNTVRYGQSYEPDLTDPGFSDVKRYLFEETDCFKGVSEGDWKIVREIMREHVVGMLFQGKAPLGTEFTNGRLVAQRDSNVLSHTVDGFTNIKAVDKGVNMAWSEVGDFQRAKITAAHTRDFMKRGHYLFYDIEENRLLYEFYSTHARNGRDGVWQSLALQLDSPEAVQAVAELTYKSSNLYRLGLVEVAGGLFKPYGQNAYNTPGVIADPADYVACVDVTKFSHEWNAMSALPSGPVHGTVLRKSMTGGESVDYPSPGRVLIT